MFLRRKLTPTDIENMRKEGNMRGLVRALQSKDSPAYMAAFQELSRIKPAPVAEIVPLLTNRDSAVRYRAVRLLGEMEDALAIPDLVQALLEGQDDEQLVTFAVRALQNLHWTPNNDRAGALYYCHEKEWFHCVDCGETAVDPLMKALSFYLHPAESEPVNTAQVEQITETLARIGKPACAAVCGLLFDPDPVVFSTVKNIVLKMGRTAVPQLVHFLMTSQQEPMCLIVVDLLHQIGDESASKALVQKLLVAQPRCQKVCSEALASIGKAETAQHLFNAQLLVINNTVWNENAADFDPRNVEITRRQLGYMERALSAIGKPALELFLQNFDTENEIHLEQMLNSIERMGTIVYDPTVALLASPQAVVRERIVEILKRLKWQPETTQQKVEYAIATREWETLQTLGEDAFPALLAALRYDSYEFRVKAAETLAAMSAPLVKDEDKVYWAVFSQQFDRLVALKRGAVKPLLHLLQEAVKPDTPHKDEAIRVPVIKGITRTLTEIGSDAVVDLVMVLEQQPNYMRVYAVNILTAIGESTVPLLINTVRKHEDSQVRELAAQALSQIKETPVSFYRDCLMNRSTELRRIGVRYFTEHPDPSMLRQLFHIIDQENETSKVRIAAIRALGSYPQEEVLPVLKNILFQSQAKDLQIAALQALKNRAVIVEDMELVGLMVDQITAGDDNLSHNAGAALGQVGGDGAVGILMDLLKHYEGQLTLMATQVGVETTYRHLEQKRLMIVQVLSLMEERAVASMFHRCAEDALPWLDSYQEVFLKIGEPAREQLIAELTSPFFYRRRLAARLLNHLNWSADNSETAAAYVIAREQWDDVAQYGMKAVNPLLELLDADQEEYQRKAAELLDVIGWEPSPDQTGCRYWIAKGQFKTCIVAGEMAVMPLVQALERTVIALDAHAAQEPAEISRLKARLQTIKEALHGIGPEGIPAITSLFTSPTTLELVRPHLSHVLLYADKPEGKHLLGALLDKNSLMVVRQQAAYALGEMGCIYAVEPLFGLVKEGSTNARFMQDCMNAIESVCKQTNQQSVLHEIRQTMQTMLGTAAITDEKLRTIGKQVINICNHRLMPDSSGNTGLK